MQTRRSVQCRFRLTTLGLSAIVLSLCAFTLLSTCPAFAALGGDAASVDNDQVHMQGSRRTTQSQAYALHEIQGASGTVVREYVSPGGKVFGVAWQGQWPPDMRQILASYFDQYEQAAAQANIRGGRRPLAIEQPGLVVHISGHLRSFTGHAYVPGMLPQGVTAEAIR